MAIKDITYKQFITHMDKGNKVYMKKPKSWQMVSNKWTICMALV